MDKLSERFNRVIRAVGMEQLTHPVFYHVPVGIRFEIGTDEDVFLDCQEDGTLGEHIVNPAYIANALGRASKLYDNLPSPPCLLRIDGYPNGEDVRTVIRSVCRASGLPAPQELVKERRMPSEEGLSGLCLQMYWDLGTFDYDVCRLLKEIIKADLGGYGEFVSSVYFADTCHSVLFHLYDDRGADLAAACRDVLRPVYEKFCSWILDYDRERVEAVFGARMVPDRKS